MGWIAQLPQPILWSMSFLIGVALYGVISGKIKLRKNKDGSFQLGDNTPFEKTNQRFKQLCHDIHDVKDIVPVVQALQKDVATLRTTVDAFAKQNDTTQMFILRATIANEQLPDSERMEAYDEYKRRGGNSWVDAYWGEQLPAIRQRIQQRLGVGK
jgi:hypothetical protein